MRKCLHVCLKYILLRYLCRKKTRRMKKGSSRIDFLLLRHFLFGLKLVSFVLRWKGILRDVGLESIVESSVHFIDFYWWNKAFKPTDSKHNFREILQLMLAKLCKSQVTDMIVQISLHDNLPNETIILPRCNYEIVSGKLSSVVDNKHRAITE